MGTICGKTCILSKNLKLHISMDCPWGDYTSCPKDLLDLVDD